MHRAYYPDPDNSDRYLCQPGGQCLIMEALVGLRKIGGILNFRQCMGLLENPRHPDFRAVVAVHNGYLIPAASPRGTRRSFSTDRGGHGGPLAGDGSRTWVPTHP